MSHRNSGRNDHDSLRRNSLKALSGTLLALSAGAAVGQEVPRATATEVAVEPISPQAVEYRDFLRALTARLRADPKMPVVRAREIYEHWGDLGGEPTGIDYEVVDVNGMMALWARPKGTSGKRVVFCTHGGGYRVGSPYSHRKMYGHLAKAADAQALILDYRRVPEATFPAAVDDCVAGYRFLLDQKIPPKGIIVAGDSAGGSLAVTTVLGARREGLPLPAGIIAMSPAVDPYATGASFDTNAASDALLSRVSMQNVGKGYLATEADARNPLATPLNSDLRGMPDLYIQVGSSEVLLDDSQKLAAAARAAGVTVKLDVYPYMQHVFQLAAGYMPEATRAVASQGAWARQRWEL